MEVPVLKLSPDGEFLALSSPDGTIKVWETKTGSLNQEYVPSSHLSSTCTCLAWRPKTAVFDTGTPGHGKKKRRSKSGGAVAVNLDLIAMGTTGGNVLLYSVSKGDIHTQMSSSDVTRVNGVCWSPCCQSYYSCSDDGFIVHWDLTKTTPVAKWKADKNTVHSVSVLHDGNRLLTASREIKLWDLKTKEVVKTFVGHSTEVRWLLPVTAFSGGGGGDASSLQSYFLSATSEDRHINAWQTSKTATASFSALEEPIFLHLSSPSVDGRPLVLLVVTRSGKLQIFEHVLNGQLKKPVKPKFSLEVASDTSSSGNSPHQIPLIGAHVVEDAERCLLLAYGSSLKPMFEKIPYSSLEPNTILVREDPSKKRTDRAESKSKLKAAEIPKDITVLAPGHMGLAAPMQGTSESKRKKRKSVDMTMEERLNALGVDKLDMKGKQSLPRTDTMCTLLAQGLQSQDKRILNHVLDQTDKTLITNTVKKLPLPVIVPLVTELSKRMHGHAQRGLNMIAWVKAVLVLHTSYLMSFPELVESFSSLYQMMENRVKTYGQLTRLQGKLNLILSQLSSQTEEPEEEGEGEDSRTQQAMLVYQVESSDEDLGMEGFAPDSSESEDNWEELSDMDVAANGDDEETLG